MSTERIVATPQGEGRLVTDRARSPIATIMLGHGAGGGIDSRDLEALARHLPRHGITVVRFEQPWRRAGRMIATPPATQDAALRAAADAMRVRTPLVLGGRSAGARSGAPAARSRGAAGGRARAVPQHPPRRPAESRVGELTGVRLPTLVIQGENDTMGRPEEFPTGTDLCVVPGADHGLKVPVRGAVSQDEALGIVVEATLEWVVREIVGNEARR